MNFVYKQNGVRFKISENSGEVAGAFNGDAGCALEWRPKRRSDEVGERRLTDSGRAIKEDMLRHTPALLGGINRDADICLRLFLSDIFVPASGAKRRI